MNISSHEAVVIMDSLRKRKYFLCSHGVFLIKNATRVLMQVLQSDWVSYGALFNNYIMS